jgi:hypothetical protein
VLVAKEEEHVLPQTLVELDMIPNLSAVADLIDGIAKKAP